MSALPLKIVVVGHVDHGKSTLVGRMLEKTGALPDGKVEYLKEVCARRGMPFEWAFVMDALQAERDQGITIDTAQVRFATKARPYVMIDAPGHKEFLKNMVTGAASAEAAVLVIDALEGVQEQSRRHAYLLHLLGLSQTVVAVNKMDAVGWSEERFRAVETEIRQYLAGIGIAPQHVVPLSARDGDLVAEASERAPWYSGPCLLDALDGFAAAPLVVDLPLRFPVQDVYKFDERRIIAGRIETGRLKVGDTLVFHPVGKTARVASIEAWRNGNYTVDGAEAGQSVGITLDEQIFVERGQIASLIPSPPAIGHRFKVRVFWLGRAPLEMGRRYKMKMGTAEHQVEVETIERVIDVCDLGHGPADRVERNGVAEVILASRSLMACDDFGSNPRLGRFVLVDGYEIAGGGIVVADPAAADHRDRVKSTNITRVSHKIAAEERWAANRHRGGVLWLTGLSGAGKSTLAMELERQLFAKGYQVFVLDGDNVRHGLCSDLGFSPEDRAENIRRIGEMAHLFAQSGAVVITAFISPYAADRGRARAIAGDLFHEVWVKADVATCETRDPKGLYKKARAGELSDFTGISAPYEEPVSPEMVVDSAHQSLDACVGLLMEYVQHQFAL